MHLLLNHGFRSSLLEDALRQCFSSLPTSLIG
jgi:hypothetical protein